MCAGPLAGFPCSSENSCLLPLDAALSACAAWHGVAVLQPGDHQPQGREESVLTDISHGISVFSNIVSDIINIKFTIQVYKLVPFLFSAGTMLGSHGQ